MVKVENVKSEQVWVTSGKAGSFNLYALKPDGSMDTNTYTTGTLPEAEKQDDATRYWHV